MNMDLIWGVVIGAIFGFCLSALFKKVNNSSSKIKELEAEHAKYRKQVDDHFVNTAVLFKGLTDQYRDVYRHIANGAGELCSDEAKALQVDMEETALLVNSTKEADGAADEIGGDLSETQKEKDLLEGRKEPPAEAKFGEENSKEEQIPLASEVEMSEDIAKEVRQRANKNKV
ncbi:MAG: ZapG family protein [Cycloclasticus sp.]